MIAGVLAFVVLILAGMAAGFAAIAGTVAAVALVAVLSWATVRYFAAQQLGLEIRYPSPD